MTPVYDPPTGPRRVQCEARSDCTNPAVGMYSSDYGTGKMTPARAYCAEHMDEREAYESRRP